MKCRVLKNRRMMQMKYSRKDDILNLIYNHTKDYVEQGTLLETDALLLSLELKVDRANISRMLNELWRKNELIKIEGRPTNYLHRKYLESIYVGSYFPSVLKKDESYRDYINQETISTKSEGVIGVEKNESLERVFSELKLSLSSTSSYKYILVAGERHSGKKFLIDRAIAHLNALDFTKITRIDCNYYYLRGLSRDVFLDSFEQIARKNNQQKIIIIEHCETLEKMYGEQFFAAFVSFYHDRIENVHIVCIYNGYLTNIDIQHIAIEKVIEVPTFESRSVLEKYKHVISCFQNEANTRRKTVSISMAILSCFVSSHYSDNLRTLRKEINASIDASILGSIHKNQRIVKIDFDELTDSLLNNISGVDIIHDQMQSVASVINSDSILFIPNTENQELVSLNACSINEDGFVIGNTKHLSSILNLVKSDLRNSQEVNTWHVRFLDLDSKYRHIVSLIHSVFNDDKHSILAYRIYEGISNTDSIFYKNELSESAIDVNQTSLVHANELFDLLSGYVEGTIPALLEVYIRDYIGLYFERKVNREISVLIACHGDKIAEKFAMHINTLSYTQECYYLNYSEALQKAEFSTFFNMVIDKVNEIDTGSGVVLLTDLPPLSNIDFSNSSRVDTKVVNISPVTLHTLQRVMNYAYMDKMSIYEIEKAIRNDVNGYDLMQNFDAIIEHNLDDISGRILNASLTFLDPTKVTRILWTVASQINEEMGFEHDERVVLRFIVHSAFMIERVIRGETYSYKKTKQVITDNATLYHCISKHFVLVNESFAITVPNQEIARLSEIFIELISA